MITNDYIYPNVQNFLYPISKIKDFKTCNTHLFYNPSTHYWIPVDDIGAEIISALESTNSYKETAGRLRAKYNINDQTIKNDVEPYIENLIKYKFYTYEKKELKTWWQQKDTSSVVKNKYPFNDIYISLTDDCNLRCIYCFNYEKRKTRQCGGKEVNVRQLKEVMSQFKELGGTGVVFTGGEPTLNKSLIPLAKYAVELGLSPKLITNGTLLDKIDINEICSVIKDITVSLDSVNVDELNELCGLPSENALESAIRGLKKIDKYSEMDKISLVIAPIVSAVNKNNLKEIVSFAKTELTHCDINWNFTKFSEIHKGASEYILLKKEIKLENVKFRYGKRRLILNNLNISFSKGEKTALIGKSGSGKTSVARLLMRFYEPEAGIIMFDGTDIKDYTLKSLRNKITYVSQNVSLIPGTLRDNLCIKKSKISDTKLDEICEIFGLTDFIKSLPNSYNSIITEGGNDFSEGQKQRISIIRALLSEPDILILDESTSSLDAFTESSIMEYIKSLTELTVIIIAHRLSTIIGCDKIYVLENGTVVEAGNHNELIDKHGVYSEMLYQQKIINERNTI